MNTNNLGIAVAAFLLGLLAGAGISVGTIWSINQKRFAARRRRAQQKNTPRQASGRQKNVPEHACRRNAPARTRLTTETEHSAKPKSKERTLQNTAADFCKKIQVFGKRFLAWIRAMISEETTLPKPKRSRAVQTVSTDGMLYPKAPEGKAVAFAASPKPIITESPKHSELVRQKEHTEELDISPQVVPGDADFAESIRKEKSRVKETAESDPEPMAAAAPEVQPVSGPKDVEEDGETLDFSAFCVGLGAEFDDVLSTDICLHRGTGYAWNPATDEVIPDEKTRAGYYTLQNLARSGMLRLFDVVIHGEVICYAMYAADEAVRQNVEYYQIASIKKAARVRANKALDYYTLEEPGALVLCPI